MISCNENFLYIKETSSSYTYQVFKYDITEDVFSATYQGMIDLSPYGSQLPRFGAGCNCFTLGDSGTDTDYLIGFDETTGLIGTVHQYPHTYSNFSTKETSGSVNPYFQIGFDAGIIQGIKVVNLYDSTTIADVRYDVSSPVDIRKLACWIQHTKFTGFSIQVAVSIVTPGTPENFVDITEDTDPISTVLEETEALYEQATADGRITLRITKTRSNITDEVFLTKLLGAVSE